MSTTTVSGSAGCENRSDRVVDTGRGTLCAMASDIQIKMRRVGERRAWPLFRQRSQYEIFIAEADRLIYSGTTTAPSAILVRKGRVHTTDSDDWIRAADLAYSPRADAWITDPFGSA